MFFTCQLLCLFFLDGRFDSVVAENGSLEFGADGNVADCRAELGGDAQQHKTDNKL